VSKKILANKTPLHPFVMFPSRRCKYVKLTSKQAFQSMIQILSNHKAKFSEEFQGETIRINARIGGNLGITIRTNILTEGNVSTLDFSFSYKRFLIMIFIIAAATFAICIIFWTPIPGIISATIFVFTFISNLHVNRFLKSID
jgi:hypothetical protein